MAWVIGLFLTCVTKEGKVGGKHLAETGCPGRTITICSDRAARNSLAARFWLVLIPCPWRRSIGSASSSAIHSRVDRTRPCDLNTLFHWTLRPSSLPLGHAHSENEKRSQALACRDRMAPE